MLRSAVTDQHEKIGSTAEVEQRLFAKIAWRFVPILTLGFLLNHLDRNNIGFAALEMNQEIGLTATQFGIGAGILFLGYCFLELPSNLLLYRVGARVWLSRIMITWGLASAAMIFVTGPKSWYALRFLLGAAEAGFFPGVAFYLSSWFPKEYRTRMLAWFLVAIPASSVVGGPLSGICLGFTVGSYGLGIWLPQIVKAQQTSNLTVGFITAGCYVLACIGMVAWAAYVDRKGNRIRNLLLTCLASAAGLVFAIFFQNFWLSLAWITVGLVGINAARSIFWVIPTRFLTGVAAAGGLAFINAVGTTGCFLGPSIMGCLKDVTGSFNAGLVAMAGCLP